MSWREGSGAWTRRHGRFFSVRREGLPAATIVRYLSAHRACFPNPLGKEETMTDKDLPQVGGSRFETLKKVNDYNAEYWSARDL